MPKCPPLGQAIYWANIFLPFLPSREPPKPTFFVKRKSCYTSRPKCGIIQIVISYKKEQRNLPLLINRETLETFIIIQP